MAVSEMLKREMEVFTPRSFILGGKSEFTIENLSSGIGFRYRVSKAKNDDSMFFVRVKEGSAPWTYGGFLSVSKSTGKVCFIQGKKGLFPATSAPIKGILYALGFGENPLPDPMLIRHHGKCACCGKSLSDPESALRGFGPTCWAKTHSH